MNKYNIKNLKNDLEKIKAGCKSAKIEDDLKQLFEDLYDDCQECEEYINENYKKFNIKIIFDLLSGRKTKKTKDFLKNLKKEELLESAYYSFRIYDECENLWIRYQYLFKTHQIFIDLYIKSKK